MLIFLIQILLRCFFIPLKAIVFLMKIPYWCGLWLHKVIKNSIKVKEKLLGAQKVGKGLISILNMGATGYSVFTVVEPFLDKKKEVK